ncbi:YrdB family protein [Microbispora sp. NEAU-D428]|uniref:YrdB family protein n=1 Tax=Microbispora sitophila TaxID=2771537 RepID=UPI0018685CFD|nr:YrdB family protein [Microbispora sitophila]MBE3010014.1 YrdB family protein [Microbispora sitophila]
MLTVAKGMIPAVQFFLELGVLISLAYWGFTLQANVLVKILLGLGGPAVFATLWGLFMAGGKAPHQLHGIARAAFEVVWFGAGAAALAASGLVTAGVVFAVAYVVDGVLRLLTDQV